MYVVNKTRNVIRGLLQRYGSKNIKKSLWNVEFSGGRWACLETAPGDPVYRYIEMYAANGDLLDLGCGSGSTANEIAIDTYRTYLGVDISDVAVGKAIRKTEENGRSDKNRFVQADCFGYATNDRYNIILFRDSIYYLPRRKIKRMLDRYAEYLKENGVFIVRLHGGSDKNPRVEKIIESNFSVVEKHVSESPSAIVIVFR
jgi:SAM-dependent methyltransferase